MIDPALLVAFPLVASVVPATTALVRPRLGWPVALAAMVGQTALSLVVARDAVDGTRVVADLGGIPAPFGVRLVVDGVAAPFVVLVAVSALGVLAYTRTAGPRSGPFYSLYLLLVAGLTGVCVTADLFNLYVFLEISGLAAYALVAARRTDAAAVAALRYLLVGTVGATLYLLGVGYVYVATGTLSMAELADVVAAGTADGTLLSAAFALVVAGLGVKVALFPVHGWKPDAYAEAPSGVAALLAALVSTVAGYAVVRLLLSAFSVAFVRSNPAVGSSLLVAGGVSIVAGSALAFRAASVRRLLAYSSVVQFGVVVVGVAVATPTSVSGAVVHLVGHAVTKAGLFLAAGVVATARGAETLDDYRGVAADAPVTSAAVVVLTLGLVGIPPTVGFAGKLYVALGTAEAGAWGAFALVVASTLFSLAYFGRLLQRMYFGDRGPGTDRDASDVSPGMYATVVVAAAATVALGLAAAALADLVAPTLEVLL